MLITSGSKRVNSKFLSAKSCGKSVFSVSKNGTTNQTFASGSGILVGASSSQSSGFSASGSGIFSLSSQSSGFLSLGSSISFGGLTGGVTSSNKLPEFTLVWSTNTSNELSGLTTKVNKCVFLPSKTFWKFPVGFFACFSSYSPVFGFLCLKMKCS